LATPVLDLAEVARRFPPPYIVDDKYDGVRAQVHKAGDRVELYSRTLDRVTNRYPELHDALLAIPGSCVLDAEILAFEGDRAVPFTRFQTRLGRKDVSGELRTRLPASLVVFDILEREGRSLLDVPLVERLGILRSLPIAPPLRLALQRELNDRDEPLVAALEREFVAARDRGDEGLMVKDPRSPCRPRLRDAFPAHRPAATGQAGERDRHARHGARDRAHRHRRACERAGRSLWRGRRRALASPRCRRRPPPRSSRRCSTCSETSRSRPTSTRCSGASSRQPHACSTRSAQRSTSSMRRGTSSGRASSPRAPTRASPKCVRSAYRWTAAASPPRPGAAGWSCASTSRTTIRGSTRAPTSAPASARARSSSRPSIRAIGGVLACSRCSTIAEARSTRPMRTSPARSPDRPASLSSTCSCPTSSRPSGCAS